MTINRLKKRYYGLSFSIAIFISTIIIFSDYMFNIFTYIPYTGNTQLKEKIEKNKFIYQGLKTNLVNIKRRNENFLKYSIKKDKLTKDIDDFFKKFNTNIKIFTITLDNIKLSNKYYNIATITLKGKSNNEYITKNFVNESIKELIKEMYPTNSSNIKLKDNKISFIYYKKESNKIKKDKK